MEDSDRGPSYWLDLFTDQTWKEFLQSGGTVSGFRESRWAYARQIKPGDRFLCYLTGVSRFVGLLEVVSEAYRDETPIWSREVFSVRLKVRVLIQLTPETGIPIKELLPQLSIYPGRSSGSWQGHVQGSPRRWSPVDGQLIEKALRDADKNPVLRPFDAKLLKYKPRKGKKQLPSPIVAVEPPTAPTTDGGQVTTVPQAETPADGAKEVRLHTEMEAWLVRLGSEMGLDLWIDAHDRNEVVDGMRLGDFPGVVEELAPQFHSELAKAVKRIDVLWLRDEAVIAAFEVESTTSVYSGLLRMADLLALQPNLSIPLFIVAPEARRNDVRREINRPTFSRALRRPLGRSCRYISFEKLRESAEQVLGMNLAKVLGKAPEDFLGTIAERVDIEAD
jgi:hypothetical protein